MRTFNIISTLLLFLVLFTGCWSHEESVYKDKALEIIKKDLISTLGNYNNYKPIETKMDSVRLTLFGDTIAQNLMKAIRNADSIILLRHDEERKAYRIYHSFGDSDGAYKIRAGNRWSSACSAIRHAQLEKQVLVDSMLSLVKKNVDFKYGWRVNHEFEYNGNNGYPKSCYYTYYFDKDCNHIILRICGENNQVLNFESGDYYWSDDYIEFANKIYEESLGK